MTAVKSSPFLLRRRGSALITVVMLTAVMALLTASMLSYTLTERRGNERNRLTLRARNMAENISVYAAEQLTTKLYRTRSQQKMAFLGSNAISMPPASVLNSSFTSATNGMEVRAGLTGSTGLVFLDPNDSANAGNPNVGLQASSSSVPIIARATATHPSLGSITSYIQHDMEVAMVPLFQFAVFYNMDMEFGPGADMTIAGPVHTNGNLIARMQTGRTSTLEFLDRVTAVNGFFANTAHKGPTWMGDGSADTGPGGTGPLYFKPPSGTHVDIKNSSNVWRDHKYSNNPGTASVTTTSLNNFKTFATSTYAGNLRTSVHDVQRLVLPSISNYAEVNDPSTPEDDRNNGRQIIERPSSSDTAGLKETKFARKAGLYIIVNPDDEDRTGYLPDATAVPMRARSYRCWLNTVNTTTLSHTMYEVVLPGQPSYGDLNATLNNLPNAYRTDTSVGHNQVLRIPKNAAELADTGYGGSALPTFPTLTDSYFYDLRRATGNSGYPFNRDASNVFTPRPMAKIDFDLTRFKMAVKRTVNNATTVTVYNPSAPSNANWDQSILNPSATPSAHGLGLGPAYNAFGSDQIVIGSYMKSGASSLDPEDARFIIAEFNGTSWNTSVYTSGSDEASHAHTITPGTTWVRVRQYLKGAAPNVADDGTTAGTTRMTDEQLIPVIAVDGTNTAVAVLSNEYHLVGTSTTGTPGSAHLPGECYTDVRIYIGGIDDTANWTFTATTAGGAGSFGTGATRNRYTLNSINAGASTVATATITAAKSGYTSLVKTFKVEKQSSKTVFTTPANRTQMMLLGPNAAPGGDPFKIYFARINSTDPVVAVASTDLVNTGAGAFSPWFDGVTVYIHSVDAENRAQVSGVPSRIDSGVRLWNGRGPVASLDPADNSAYIGRTGFSFATNDAIYVVGHFNADGNVTSASSRYPETSSEMLASVMGDATTILSQPRFTRSGTSPNYLYTQSEGWSDSLSGHRHLSSNYSSSWRTTNPSSGNARDGAATSVVPGGLPNLVSLAGGGSAVTVKFAGGDTEISTCFLIGIVPTNHNPTGLTTGAPSTSSNGQTSGGVHNYPRLQEYWSGDLYIRGSMVAMFESRVAMEPWSIRYYNAPGRFWGLHESLRNANHDLPLEPMLLTARRMGFKEITAAEYSAQKAVIEALPY